MTSTIFKRFYLRMPKVLRLLIGVILVMTFFGFIVHILEPAQFPTVFEGVWWAIVTAATVGYGDYAPVSVPGRLVGMAIILTGGGTLAYYITTLSRTAIKRQSQRNHGEIEFNGKGHVVLIGWNERTRQLTHMINTHNPDTQLVLIDTKQKRPDMYEAIHYIQGDATLDATLKQAAIPNASRVLVTADTSTGEQKADHMTILTTLAVRGLHKDLPIVTEIMTDKQIENAKRAGATTVIRPNEFLSSLLYHELAHTPDTSPFEYVLKLLNSQQFKQYTIEDPIPFSNFKQATTDLLEKDFVLLGVKRSDEWVMNPKPEFELQADDVLLMFAPWSTKNV